MSQNFKVIALVVTEKMKKVKEGGSGGKVIHNSGIVKIGLRSNLSVSFL